MENASRGPFTRALQGLALLYDERVVETPYVMYTAVSDNVLDKVEVTRGVNDLRASFGPKRLRFH